VISKIAPDKWKHFFVGIGMGLLFQLAGWYFMAGHLVLSAVVSFSIIAAISYGFEIYSKFTGHGHYEVLDAIASIIGGVLGMGIIWAGIGWIQAG
jgi:VanZ family protein